jgi:hypothetical protein
MRTGVLSALVLTLPLGAGAAPTFVVGPYKYAPMAIDAVSAQMRSAAADGTAQPLPRLLPAGAGTVSWAFALGECGSERWGEGIDTDRFAAANVQAFVAAGIDYIVSTGGEGHVFSCGSDEGMERFIARYDSPRLVGIDLDIESTQTDDGIAALVRRVKAAQARHPRLRFSFTLPTFAAADGSGRSLNALGERVLQAIRRQGLAGYRINLMAMDYGPASPSVCVVEQGRCDMARSGLQAAQNLHAAHGVPLAQIELTAMIGVNDVVSNVFTIADAHRMAAEARKLGLGGVHFWSLDRDTPCGEPQAGASDHCSGVSAPPLSFTRVFAAPVRPR